MKAEDREALISLVEDINNAVCADVEDAGFLTSLNFGSTGSLDYLGMSFEDVWNEDTHRKEDVFECLRDAYYKRILESSAALRALQDMKREGYYKRFQTPVDEEG